MLIAVIVLGVVCVVLLLLLFRKSVTPEDTSSTLLLKQDLTELNKNVQQLREGLSEKLGEKLEKNSQTVHETIQRQFSQSAKIISEVSQRLIKLEETNKRVGDVADELKVLQSILSNPKQRGVLGEYYLQTVLENVLPTGAFQMQYKFKDGEAVDAVIFLDRGRIVPIDSKFSLENYNRLLEEKDKNRRVALAKAFKTDLKQRIDETSKYIRPREGTLDYAFMFIPSEAIYYDLLINKVGLTQTSARDLIEYAFRDRKVIIVSPTTLLAYLQTVLQGLRSLKIEEQAKEIQHRVSDLSKHIASHETFMQKLGNSLGTTVNHYNAAHKELGKVDKDIIKIAGAESKVDPILLDRPSSGDDVA